jgi:hypothetical protein
MSTLKVDTMTTVSGQGLYPARAWVNFNGTGAVAIRADGDVASITDLAVGQYRVTFSYTQPNANYAVSGSGHDLQTFNQGQASTMLVADALATTSVIAGSCYAGTSLYSRDAELMNVMIHR